MTTITIKDFSKKHGLVRGVVDRHVRQAHLTPTGTTHSGRGFSYLYDEAQLELVVENIKALTSREIMKGQIKSGELVRSNPFDAGQDVVSSEEVVIPARSSALVSTGLCINVPSGYVGLLWSRSGLSVKHKIEVGAGCIDSGYHGEVKVHLYNHSDVDFLVGKGGRIAQLLTIPVSLAEYKRVDEFEDSARGTNGFGSTGL